MTFKHPVEFQTDLPINLSEQPAFRDIKPNNTRNPPSNATTDEEKKHLFTP